VLGGCTAVLVMRRLGEARTVGVGLALIAVGALGEVVPHLPPVLAGQAVLGLGVPWFVVGWSTGLQRFTPSRLQGRVTAAANMMLSGPQTASIALGAALIAVVDYRIMLVVIFAGMGACGLLLLLRPAATTTTAPVSAVSTAPVC
jgi:hypothetical protein